MEFSLNFVFSGYFYRQNLKLHEKKGSIWVDLPLDFLLSNAQASPPQKGEASRRDPTGI
jgi:hypothetical protein